MPYIVMTRNSRKFCRAVRTREEARGALWEAITASYESVDNWPSRIPDVQEVGGTFGPFRSGLIVDVEYLSLAEMTLRIVDLSESELIAAYNLKRGHRP